MEDRFKIRVWTGTEMLYPREGFTLPGKSCVTEVGGTKIDDEGIILPMGSIPMQCTGLKDKNGVLIWEGDILKFGPPVLHEVSIGKLRWTERGWHCKGDTASVYITGAVVCEIIGNIHENPELLGT